MATNRARTQKQPQKEAGFEFSKIIPPKYNTVAAIGFIIILCAVFFAPMYFGGKTVASGDILNMQSYKNFYNGAQKFLWDPYVFMGMPIFGKIGWFDFSGTFLEQLVVVFSHFFASDYAGWTFYSLLMGIFFYSLMRNLKATILVSLFVSAAAMLSTGVVTLFFIGHITKFVSLVAFPLILLFLLRFNNKIKLLDVLLFVLTMHFLFKQWHVQIMFYMFFTAGMFYLYYFIRSLAVKDKLLTMQVLKSLGVFIVVAVIAFGMNYYKLRQIQEYTEYSTRGGKSITDIHKNVEQKDEEEFYQYATNWSFSPGEVMTFIIPSYFGYGNSTYKGPLSNNEEVQVNTYFGQMPFVDVAQYMGIVVLALGLFAMFACRKNPFVQFLTILIVISVILSFGRTFPVLFNIFFYNFPYFDKFRAPSMILNIVQLSLPILAGIGLMEVLSIKKEMNAKRINTLKITAYILSGLFVVSLLLNSALTGWFTSRVAETGQKGEQLKPLYDYMSSMFTGDMLFSFAAAAAVFWLAYLYIKGKFSFDGLTLIIIILAVIDLWRIDYRAPNFVSPAEITQRFEMPDYISAIKSQKNTSPYRLLNLKQDGSLGSFNQNNNYHVTFLEEDFYGYSGIKPRSFQDIADVIGPVNITLWRMLNVKYIITDKPAGMPGFKNIYSGNKSFVYENENALPRAYFVDTVETAQPMEVLNAIKANSFDPKHKAYAEGETIKVDPAGTGAYTKITRYENELVEIEANATGNNLLFMSSTYYPLGWKAKIDGNPVEIHKINHGFMGVVVPAGKHTVQFVYEPATFYTGRTLTLSLNILIFAGLLFALWRDRKNKAVKEPINAA